jgi:hypothetical protein
MAKKRPVKKKKAEKVKSVKRQLEEKQLAGWVAYADAELDFTCGECSAITSVSCVIGDPLDLIRKETAEELHSRGWRMSSASGGELFCGYCVEDFAKAQAVKQQET